MEKGFVNVMPLPTHSYKELRQEAGMKLHAHMCKFETDAVRLVGVWRGRDDESERSSGPSQE